MNARATISPGLALSATQRAALHVGPTQGLPHDPLALVLYARSGADASIGFAVGALDAAEIGVCSRALMLAPSPGVDRRLTESSGSFGGLKSPTNVAVGRNGTVYLADRGNAVVKYFDVCDCSFRPLPCFVPQGPAAPADECIPSPPGFAPLNQLRDPTALAVAGHDLVIVDRGHHRVVLMDLIGSVPRGALRLPVFTGLRKLWTPFAAAVDSHGHIYVSDPDHARVDAFGRDGRWHGAWTGLGEVTHLAVDVDDVLLAVIEDVEVDATGKLIPGAFEIIDGQRRPLPPRAIAAAGRFPCSRIAVDCTGRLHLGAACANPADAVFDAQGYPVKEKDKVAPLLYATNGSYRSSALDSRRRGCIWHRVLLAGAMPERTRIDIQTTTSDVELDAGELADLPAQAWSDVVSVLGLEGGSADTLVRSPPGRYLWLRLTMSGDGQATPCISQIVVEFPRVSLRRYLPGVYGMDPIGADFTDRFTALFDATLRSIETRIDTMHELFDPSSAPAEKPRAKPRDGAPTIDFLSWIAGWVGVTFDRGWPEATRRAILKQAAWLYGLRGTYAGLWPLLLTFLGFERTRCEGACPQAPAASAMTPCCGASGSSIAANWEATPGSDRSHARPTASRRRNSSRRRIRCAIRFTSMHNSSPSSCRRA